MCTYLNIQRPQVQRMMSSNPNDESEAFFECLWYWCSNADEPTWGILLEALKQAELKRMAEDLKSKLLEGSL